MMTPGRTRELLVLIPFHHARPSALAATGEGRNIPLRHQALATPHIYMHLDLRLRDTKTIPNQ